jgi:hypothetical protein
MTVIYAFQAFEGAADARFLPEAYQVLKDNSKKVVLPLPD